MKLKFNGFLVLLLVLVAQLTFAQERAVSGTVTDNTGMPLPGVSVLVKGTKSGTQTDFDGKFSIKASSSQVLVFSYIGMKTQEIAASSTTVNVKLADDSVELESVVITAALGIKREKKSLSYAAQDLKGSVLNEGGTNNAVSALSGNVAGLQVTAPSTMGGSTRIVMRGVGSVTGENRPLIVVDGIPLDNGNYNTTATQRGAGGRDYGDASADINPDDIESVTVLKGGPAAALYGSRAGNGAILYTTKSAKKSGGKSEISFNTGMTFESIYIMPKLQDEYGGGSSTTFQDQVINGRTYKIADYATDESWGPKYDPTLMYLPWNAFDPEFANDYLKERAWVKSPNDVESFFRTGITRNNSISFSKSSQDSGVRFSYANQKTEGVVPNSSLTKNTLSINANAKLSEKLKVEGMATYVQTRGFNRPEVGYGDNGLAQKFFQWGQRQLDFNEMKDYKLANGAQRSWNRIAWNDPTPNYSDNPYWIIYENTSSDKRNRVYGNKITYNFTPELYAVGNVYADTYSLNINEQVAIGSQATPSFTTSARNLTDFNYEGRLHYDKKFDKFSLNSFVGANRRSYNFSRVTGATVGGLSLPNIYNLSNSVAQASGTNFEEQTRTNSLYGFLSLGYDDFLFLEVTDRQDWFSTVKEPVNYASITGSFIFSELANVSWLNYGKIRGGWAQAGNATTAYQLANYAVIDTPFQGDPRYSQPNLAGNPDLVPELKTTKEIGLELSLFDRRLGLDLTYYDVVTTDLITSIQVDGATGYNAKLFNAGKLQNKGIEATVTANPVRTNDFRWDITWNFAKNENELVELVDGTNELSIANAPFQARLLAVVGQPFGQIYGTDFTYDANGNKIVDADGAYVPSAQKSLGTTTPKYNMGLRNSFKYKNLSFGFLIDVQEGGNYFSTSHMWGSYSGMLEATAANGIRENGIVVDAVYADGTKNTSNLPGQAWAQQHYGLDAMNVFDASYIKLREVTFGYSLPKKIIGPLSDIRFSLFARNLFTWGLDWDGMDPEMASYGSGNTQGLEGGSLPSTRTYGMNLELKF
ncbi:SusC/RagA family TonB-linked outer membrane protein [Flavobacterium sp. GA093]|uniref:SusC/RagA family TonB-linked outer membrane protein n=1 Tax=Flavobacterium hydrocarbonoxydans TaxID=2683249 RepID=A0A6I4NIY5_9FLAO|nr:SusC/RagA family TonB-linked outer membrane protein [Flavobacterium hydrocarbonoxydans]MWB94430.1 SusC/RagA family TonB-linked outer membrane protein [Flavobacterium hydrocarbonoxydans]